MKKSFDGKRIEQELQFLSGPAKMEALLTAIKQADEEIGRAHV